MQNINISERSETGSEWVFNVEVKEDKSSATYKVILQKADQKRIAPGHAASELVWASFLFLLDRESKESIFSNFDVMDIAKHFPEYEKKIKDYL